MRCRGLTSDRHRCTAESDRTTEYCEAHQFIAAANDRRNEPLLPSRSGIAGLVQKFRASANSPVPDDVRFDIPTFLKKSATPQVISYLLTSPDVMVRWYSAFALRRRRDRSALEPLWQALQGDLSSLVRQQCAVALGKIGTSAVLGALTEALWHDPDPGVRQACAIALGNLGCGVAAGDLAGLLEREQSVFVRWDVVLALGQVGDRVVEPILTELSETDKSQVVRSACCEALDDIHRRSLRSGG
jgi:HEAT repeat protein